MTTINVVQNSLNAIVAAMNAKNLIVPEASAMLRAEAKGYVSVSWWKRDPKEVSYDHKNCEVKSFNFDGDIDAALISAAEFVDTIPSKAERDKAQFMEQLSETIELGKRVGIEDGFVNPLLDMMKRLSENAITDQSGAV